MKKLNSVFVCSLLLTFFSFVPPSFAAESTKKSKMGMKKTKNPTSKKESKKESNLTTDASFSDQAVGGKYQLPMEALSVVENEKSIDDLIGVRKNFNDRILRTKGMR